MGRGLNILLTVAATMILIAGMRAFGSSLGPIFLALVVVVVVSPVYGLIRRTGMPPLVATVGLFTIAFGVLTVMMLALIWTGTELVRLLTSDGYTDRLVDAQHSIEDQLAAWGYTGEDLGDAVQTIDLNAVVGQVTSALSSLLSISGAIGLVLITMVFIVMDAGRFMTNLDHVARARPQVATALHGFAEQTRTYFVVSTVFGLIVAGLDVVALLILGVPLPFVWGVLSLITNYIPNVGFLLGLAPPATLAFFEGGWQLSLWVIVVYTVFNVVVQSVIQPKIVGDAVGLSATLTFVSLIFWGWVLGALGALLAVPMTLLAKALLIDADPSARWAAPLISLRRIKDEEVPEVFEFDTDDEPYGDRGDGGGDNEPGGVTRTPGVGIAAQSRETTDVERGSVAGARSEGTWLDDVSGAASAPTG
jgi:predicted PurR-regulated permease PerM